MRKSISFFLFCAIIVASTGNLFSYEINDHKAKLEVVFRKDKFKLFEPVQVLVKYINTGDNDDSLYYLLTYYADYLKFSITDEKGHICECDRSNNLDFGISVRPVFILQPGDTAIGIFNLYSSNVPVYDTVLWGRSQEIYFQPGKYTGFAHAEHDVGRSLNPPLKSINFEFEVLPLDKEDSVIIGLSKEQKFTKIIKKYPESYFIEYAYSEKLRQTFIKRNKNEETDHNVIIGLLNYIQKFPNSYSSINYAMNYIVIMAPKEKQDLIDKMDYFKKIYPGSEISSYLSNKVMRMYLLKSILE